MQVYQKIGKNKLNKKELLLGDAVSFRKTQRKSNNRKRIDIEKLLAENLDLLDMSCECCPKVFDSLDEAQKHYADEHNNPRGFIKCCKHKLRTRYQVKEHLAFHRDRDRYKYV